MNNIHSAHVSPLFQISVFALASAILAILFYAPFFSFRYYESLPELIPYNSVQLRNDSGNESSATNNPIQVYMGMSIHHFLESDIVKSNISVDATVWFAYDPQTVSRQQIEQFSFDAATYEKIQSYYTLYNGLEIATFDIHLHAKMDFNFRKYPLDEHRIWFSLKNNLLPVEKYHFMLMPESLVLDSFATINNSMSENASARVGFVKQKLTVPSYKPEICSSRAIFYFDCNPVDMRHFLNIFLPLYLIFFLTLFSFSFVYAEHVTDVPSIAAAGVPALFAYRFVIETFSPNVSYFMISDYLFFLYLILSLITFLSVSWALNASVYTKKMIIVSLYSIMILGSALIVYGI